MHPWRTPFPIWNQSVVPCPVLTVASWPAYRFLKRQVVWYSHLFQNFPQFIVIHTVKGFGTINKAEIDVFQFFIIPLCSKLHSMAHVSHRPGMSSVTVCWMNIFVCFIIKDTVSVGQQSACCVTCSWSGRVAEALTKLLYEAVHCPELGPGHQMIRFSSRQHCRSINSMKPN